MDINEFMVWKGVMMNGGNDWDYSERVWISDGKGLVKGDLKGVRI